MLYSEILLEAVKSASLADDDLAALSADAKRQYAGYLRNAVARFNNNPNISIGTEKVVVQKWWLDKFSYFARLVRSANDDLELFDEGEDSRPQTNVSRIKWRGIDGGSLQELPQRLISATVLGNTAAPQTYSIVNEKNFFEIGKNAKAISYAVEENQGIARVWRPEPLLLLFDRAILFPWEAKPDSADSADPLDVQIMLPSSHVPYLINLAALEIANGINSESEHIAQLKDKLAAQERELMRNNVRDRVKLSFENRNYAAHFWASRGE